MSTLNRLVFLVKIASNSERQHLLRTCWVRNVNAHFAEDHFHPRVADDSRELWEINKAGTIHVGMPKDPLHLIEPCLVTSNY
eukprot:5191493-Amphidinium_carterae.1